MRAAKTILYRCYSEDGRLLYVGVTSNLPQRLATHRKSWWGWQLVTHTVERFQTQAEAMAAEKVAIVAERPRFNRQGRWADRTAWTVEDYRDYYDATRLGEFSGYQKSRMANTRLECEHRYGVDIGVETTLKNKETVR